MDNKAQGALEYLLLIGGAVLIAIIVIAVITGLATNTKPTGLTTEAICQTKSQATCATTDVDSDGSTDCTWIAAAGEIMSSCHSKSVLPGSPGQSCSGEPGCAGLSQADCTNTGDGTCSGSSAACSTKTTMATCQATGSCSSTRGSTECNTDSQTQCQLCECMSYAPADELLCAMRRAQQCSANPKCYNGSGVWTPCNWDPLVCTWS